MAVRWMFGTIFVEDDDLILEQDNTYTTGVFRKTEHTTDSRRVIPLRRLLRVVKWSEPTGAHLMFKIKGEELSLGYFGCRDKEDVLELLEAISPWAIVEEDGNVWQAGQADVRAATQPLGTPDPTGKVPALTCGNCGAPIPHRARTCPHCGASLA